MNVDEIKNEIAELEEKYKLFPSIEIEEKIKKLRSELFFIENEEKEKKTKVRKCKWTQMLQHLGSLAKKNI